MNNCGVPLQAAFFSEAEEGTGWLGGRLSGASAGSADGETEADAAAAAEAEANAVLMIQAQQRGRAGRQEAAGVKAEVVRTDEHHALRMEPAMAAVTHGDWGTSLHATAAASSAGLAQAVPGASPMYPMGTLSSEAMSIPMAEGAARPKTVDLRTLSARNRDAGLQASSMPHPPGFEFEGSDDFADQVVAAELPPSTAAASPEKKGEPDAAVPPAVDIPTVKAVPAVRSPSPQTVLVQLAQQDPAPLTATPGAGTPPKQASKQGPAMGSMTESELAALQAKLLLQQEQQSQLAAAREWATAMLSLSSCCARHKLLSSFVSDSAVVIAVHGQAQQLQATLEEHGARQSASSTNGSNADDAEAPATADSADSPPPTPPSSPASAMEAPATAPGTFSLFSSGGVVGGGGGSEKEKKKKKAEVANVGAADVGGASNNAGLALLAMLGGGAGGSGVAEPLPLAASHAEAAKTLRDTGWGGPQRDTGWGGMGSPQVIGCNSDPT